MEYEPVIGLEIHAQIHTASKMFCACPVVEDSGDLPPNAYVCPVCAGMPGTLPVVNRRAVELTIMTGLALHCQISPLARFARKSYFYPDLPKGYQISQYDLPLAADGYLVVETGGGSRRVRVNNVHLEEDAGKLYHTDSATLVDLNRAGVPLIEIVSAPDMRSAEEAHTFAAQVRDILVYLGVNSGDMQTGAIRFEASVSVRPVDSGVLNPRHEIKNLNSFRALRRAVEYEIGHQLGVVRGGGSVVQQTMGWDEDRGVTYVQRTKEHAHDYRYFPEPDLPPLEVSAQWVERLRSQLPELPAARQARFLAEYGLRDSTARLLAARKAVADFFEAAVALGRVAPQAIANWVVGELFQMMKEAGSEADEIPVSPGSLVELVELVAAGTVNRNTARQVLEQMVVTGQDARAVIEERGLAQISDQATLRRVVAQVLDGHPAQVEAYHAGREQVVEWLMGRVMKATQGQANPRVALALLRTALEARREPR